MNRLLPKARPDQTAAAPGRQVDQRLDSRLLDAATTLGRRAAERFNETHPTKPEEEMTGSPR